MTYFMWLTEQLPAYYLVNYETDELMFQVFAQARQRIGLCRIISIWNRIYN